MEEKTILYRDGIQVKINTKDLKHWVDLGWSKVKKEKPSKKKFEKQKED